jgi:hypothetical protein
MNAKDFNNKKRIDSDGIRERERGGAGREDESGEEKRHLLQNLQIPSQNLEPLPSPKQFTSLDTKVETSGGQKRDIKINDVTVGQRHKHQGQQHHFTPAYDEKEHDNKKQKMIMGRGRKGGGESGRFSRKSRNTGDLLVMKDGKTSSINYDGSAVSSSTCRDTSSSETGSPSITPRPRSVGKVCHNLA